MPPELSDKIWRLTHLYKIKDKDGNLINFNFNEVQRKHFLERRGHRYNLILKARQFGFTTMYCIDYLDEALWVPGMTCAIVAHEREAVLKIFQIVKRAYDNLPEGLKPIARYDTKMEYQFTHRFDGTPLDSGIYVAMKVRSGTVQKLHITESAFNKDRQELKAGSKQAVPLTGSISEETTGNGFNEFFDDFDSALQNPNPGDMDYKAYFYPWFLNSAYTLPGEITDITIGEQEIKDRYSLTDGQLLWRRWKMRELRRTVEGVGLTGEQLFKQEYPASVSEAFQSGAGNIFDTEKIDNSIPGLALDYDECFNYLNQFPAENRDNILETFSYLRNNEAVFFKMPEIGVKYTIGVDPSDGEGADFGAIAVWTQPTELNAKKTKVAEYYGKRRPDDLAYIAVELSKLYNRAFLGVENNMLTTVLEVSKLYDNYYFTTTIDERTAKKTRKLGWNTNSKTRDVMIDDFIKLFDEDELSGLSNLDLSQMKTFVKKDNGKREHADGKHDDMLFADFVAVQIQKFNAPRARVFANKPF